MTPTQVKKIEEKINRLEKLVFLHLQQESEEDWLDDPRIIAKLNKIAKVEKSISEDDVDFEN